MGRVDGTKVLLCIEGAKRSNSAPSPAPTWKCWGCSSVNRRLRKHGTQRLCERSS